MKRKRMKKTVESHEEEYIHILKVKLLPLLGTLFFGILAWLNLYLISPHTLSLVFGNKEQVNQLVISDLVILYPLIGEYILIALTLISFAAIIKKGYSSLKSYDEGGLVNALFVGLVGGLFIGLVNALFVGLVVGLVFGLVGGLFVGLVGGLVGELEE